MSLEEKVMAELKEAMKSKDEAALRSLRAIKSEIIKVKTDPGTGGTVTADAELKLLQKLVKSRKDSLEIFTQQNRPELAQKEQEEIAIIERFLPRQLSEDEIRTKISAVIAEVGATGPLDMGKVMGAATKQLAGQADGKVVSAIVKELLSK